MLSSRLAILRRLGLLRHATLRFEPVVHQALVHQALECRKIHPARFVRMLEQAGNALLIKTLLGSRLQVCARDVAILINVEKVKGGTEGALGLLLGRQHCREKLGIVKLTRTVDVDTGIHRLDPRHVNVRGAGHRRLKLFERDGARTVGVDPCEHVAKLTELGRGSCECNHLEGKLGKLSLLCEQLKGVRESVDRGNDSRLASRP
mmetsp:Transcript_10337/g.21098  ORF Transcript_10337/g.21098 Transcript_10337/m.21098 type:complete len:205 (-) Transcript_10337:734-1348(-)